MNIYDTALRRHVQWDPPHTTRMYVCGITPYDSAHLGHIFTFMTYDLLQRRLEDSGREVIMVRNITDVDEPIYKKARELGVSYTELAASETAAFQRVLDQLHFRTPSHQPLASNYIHQMAASVSRLLESGIAYRLSDDIYFDISKDQAYGSFCGFNERLRIGLLKIRGSDIDIIRPGKRQAQDFILWRGIVDMADPAAWETPLGRGRPGWHIECSVMASELLGTPFDLHGGGTDLIFPHHESEIAQTRAIESGEATQLSRHWLHVSPLLYGGEKMSKSLGNLVFAKDLLETYQPAVIRLGLMHYHYRTGGEWTPELLDQSADLLHDIYQALPYATQFQADKFAQEIRSALDDDLDTHRIVHELQKLAEIRNLTPNTPQVQQSDAGNQIIATLTLIGLIVD